MNTFSQNISVAHFARVFGGQPSLPEAQLVSVETDMSRGLHAFTIVGLPNKAVEEARDRVASAIKNSGFTSPKSTNKKIVVSLAPAELKKEGSVFDLPIALSYLLAAGDLSFDTDDKVFAGELALDGSIRPVRGALPIALLARARGIPELYIPMQNLVEASLVSGISIYGVEHLAQLIFHLNGTLPLSKSAMEFARPQSDTVEAVPLSDIRGQESAKRGLEIAAAGRHNIALYGPPGTGKTMLARAVMQLLPPLSESEIVEVTSIHSLAGLLAHQQVVHKAPFRAPHHTASYPSIIGGGPIPQPGEVTLAHRGVLFLDEFPEFHRDVINALREPLEDGCVSIARARGKALFPANFMLVAALNPCPCGAYGTPRCQCSQFAIERYKRKISGPVADRIDMWVHVGEMSPEALTGIRSASALYETVLTRERILTAHQIQQQRFQSVPKVCTNANMGIRELEEYAHISTTAETTLVSAVRTLKLSARGYHRTIKLARTIADLEGSPTIEVPHMLEALQYRVRGF